MNLSPIERQNIVANVKYENNPDYYEDIKKAVKLLEGSLLESKTDDKNDPSVEKENYVYYNSQRYKKF